MGDGGGAELTAPQDEPHRKEPASAQALADEEEEQGLPPAISVSII